MTTDHATNVVREIEAELERAVHAEVGSNDAGSSLARLLSAFDVRRRTLETLRVRASARPFDER